MTDNRITIAPATGKWVVRAGGAVIAESNSALELSEGDLPPVIYFPREDIAMAFLDSSEQTSTSLYIGEANYFDAALRSSVIPNAGWTYENPNESVKDIAGYIAFYTDKMTVEQL